MQALSRRDALKIIEALKRGTPPPPPLARYLHVGRSRWIDGMAWYLDAAREDELSAVRFIVGDYGSGKTHFLRVTAHLAYERSFVVSEVALDKDVRLDRFDTVWRKLLENLTIGWSTDDKSGIEYILMRWCARVEAEERLTDELVALDYLTGLDPDFRQAVRGYLREWMTYRESTAGLTPYLQWFKGDPIRPPGIRARIDRASSRAMLRSLVVFLRYLGYSGLVLFLDEIELLLTQRPSVRNGSYEVLRQFIDDTESIPSLVMLCSLTEQALQDNRSGIPSYPALNQRIGGLLTGFSPRDYRSVTVNLNRLPLEPHELFELAQRIRDVHALAHSWNAAERVPDEVLKSFAERASRTVEVPTPRFLVQLTVIVLESAQQNLDVPLEKLIPSDADVVSIVRAAERERYASWDVSHDDF
ncbi:hypothetical protein HRbin28_00121 [bacterium HR28]|nr:hypothetical protein HRbin28_00121 [bacterium HR28]